MLERTGNTNRLWVKEGTAPWVLVSDNVAKYAISGNRIGVIFGAAGVPGSLYVKEGPLNAGWTQLLSGAVREMDLTPTRIGVVVADGEQPCTGSSSYCDSQTVFTKSGPVNAGWKREMSGIYGQFCSSKVYGCVPITLKMQLTDNRIFVSMFNRLVATEADSPVITLTENASAWDAHDTRVCATIAGHGLHCKLTSLTGPWVKATADDEAFPVLGEGRFGWFAVRHRMLWVADAPFSTSPTLVMQGAWYINGTLQTRAAVPGVVPVPKRG